MKALRVCFQDSMQLLVQNFLEKPAFTVFHSCYSLGHPIRTRKRQKLFKHFLKQVPSKKVSFFSVRNYPLFIFKCFFRNMGRLPISIKERLKILKTNKSLKTVKKCKSFSTQLHKFTFVK